MKKIVKRTGGSTGIYFSKDDQKVYGFKVGDIIEIEIIKVTPMYLDDFVKVDFKDKSEIDWESLNKLVDKDIQKEVAENGTSH